MKTQLGFGIVGGLAVLLGVAAPAAAQDIPPHWGLSAPVAPAPLEGDLRERTHNFIMPTGQTLAKGQYEVAVHEFIWMRAAYGLTDSIEIYTQVPYIPVAATVGARVSLTGRDSAFKIVAGGSIGGLLMDDWEHDDGGDEPMLVSGTLTVGWNTGRIGLHATGSFITVTGDDDDAIGVTAVGASYRLSPRVALFAEVAKLTVGDPEQADRFGATAFGVKLMGDNFDADLGLLTLDLDSAATCDGCYDEDEPEAIPAVSITWHP